MVKRWWTVDVIFWLSFFQIVHANQRCGRIPSEFTAPRSSSVGKFRLRIFGNPESYIPDANYTVLIEGEAFDHHKMRFTEFNLVVESQGNGFDPGKFEVRDLAQTKFSENCRNMIKQTTSSYKERVIVQWTAPPSGNGCVTFRTTVIVRKDTWFQDDEPLLKTLCEDHQKVFDEQPPELERCNACSEATYEVTFEGLWSRHTHPNNFPQDLFQTRFSKIIGASHNQNYSLWQYEREATDGFKEVAENGDISALEKELKEQGSNIRTIIRAPGIGHPDTTKKTFATFRTTSEHHLMSLVSMIVPSPDWIVGVSRLELCLSNHSWVDKKTLNLYPCDAGTDSGTMYESPDDPTIPREVIHRIRVDDPNSPFYDKNGEPMKPLARLQVVRLNLFEKECAEYIPQDSIESNGISAPWENNEESNVNKYEVEDSNENDKEICSVGNWGEWTSCEADCAKDKRIGYRSRQRQYKMAAWLVSDCNRTLSDFEKCYVSRNMCWEDSQCGVTSWTDWSSCYTDHPSSCKKRVRYRHITGGESCANAQDKPDLMVLENCAGNPDNCEEESNNLPIATDPQQDSPDPKNCKWQFGNCNATCGEGYQELRLVRKDESAGQRMYNGYRTEDEDSFCDRYPAKTVACDTQIPCKEDTKTPEGDNFSSISDMTESQIKPLYQGMSPNPVIDCVTTRWSSWSTCSASCGLSFTYRTRTIETHAQNGGKSCPHKLQKRKRCHKPPCEDKEDADSSEGNTPNKNGCKYSSWTPWSACTVTCGEGKKQKTRSVIDKIPGVQCDERIKTNSCIRPACRQH